MANQVVIDIVRARSAGLVAQGRALAGLPHPWVKGRLREMLVDQLVNPFLPPPVTIKTGTIVGRSGPRNRKNEDDVVIFDPRRSPILWMPAADSREAILPVDGVAAVIEVKSRLTRGEIRSAASGAIELMRLAGGQRPLGCVFGYETDVTVKTDLERLLDDVLVSDLNYAAAAGEPTSPIQLMCVAGAPGPWQTPTAWRDGTSYLPSRTANCSPS